MSGRHDDKRPLKRVKYIKKLSLSKRASLKRSNQTKPSLNPFIKIIDVLLTNNKLIILNL